MCWLFLSYVAATAIGLSKARGTYEVTLVLLPSALVVIAYVVAPLLEDVHHVLLKVLCMLFAAGLPVVAIAHINTRRKREGPEHERAEHERAEHERSEHER